MLRPLMISPLVLAKVLQSDFVSAQLLRNNIGIAYPAFDESCLPSIVLPMQKDDVDELAPDADAVDRLRARLLRTELQFQEQIDGAMKKWSHE